MYYLIESQHRADGTVNITTTARSSFASGLSLYHERYSKMLVNTEFPRVALLLVDAELHVVEHVVLTIAATEEVPANG